MPTWDREHRQNSGEASQLGCSHTMLRRLTPSHLLSQLFSHLIYMSTDIELYICVGCDLKDHLVPTVPCLYFPVDQAAQCPILLALNTSRDSVSTASLGNLWWCLTTLKEQNFCLISNPNLPSSRHTKDFKRKQSSSCWSHQAVCPWQSDTINAIIRHQTDTEPLKKPLKPAKRRLSPGVWQGHAAVCFLLTAAPPRPALLFNPQSVLRPRCKHRGWYSPARAQRASGPAPAAAPHSAASPRGPAPPRRPHTRQPPPAAAPPPARPLLPHSRRSPAGPSKPRDRFPCHGPAPTTEMRSPTQSRQSPSNNRPCPSGPLFPTRRALPATPQPPPSFSAARTSSFLPLKPKQDSLPSPFSDILTRLPDRSSRAKRSTPSTWRRPPPPSPPRSPARPRGARSAGKRSPQPAPCRAVAP